MAATSSSQDVRRARPRWVGQKVTKGQALGWTRLGMVHASINKSLNAATSEKAVFRVGQSLRCSSFADELTKTAIVG